MTSQASAGSFWHQLPNGLHLEVLHQPAVTPAHIGSSLQPRPPLLFLHGAGHAAWCWQVRTDAQPQWYCYPDCWYATHHAYQPDMAQSETQGPHLMVLVS